MPTNGKRLGNSPWLYTGATGLWMMQSTGRNRPDLLQELRSCTADKEEEEGIHTAVATATLQVAMRGSTAGDSIILPRIPQFS